MFTGIIEEVGEIRQMRHGRDSYVISVGCRKVLEGTRVGDSIAVNGVCLTVTSLDGGGFTADVMPESVHRTSLEELSAKSRVNLERAMPADGRFGGHIVSGHVDGVGQVADIRQDDNAVWYTVAAPDNLLRYVVEKGSVALDGISLTVAAVDAAGFRVSVIPHTRQETALAWRRVGSRVNVECDILAKYVEKLLGYGAPAAAGGQAGTPANAGRKSRITEEFLRMHGF